MLGGWRRYLVSVWSLSTARALRLPRQHTFASPLAQPYRAMRTVADEFPTIPPEVRALLYQFDEQPHVFASLVADLPLANPLGVYANSELHLGDVRWAGFDFDFSLAHYNNRLLELIYDLAKRILVERLKYPAAMLSFAFDSSFPVRGLSFDTRTGLLTKLSSLSMVSLAFRGHTPLTHTEILQAYQGCLHISRDYNAQYMRPMLDHFSLSEVCLLADTIQYFLDHKIPYDALSVYEDVHTTIASIHDERILHRMVMHDLPSYVTPSPELGSLLQRMRTLNKCQLFLLSNSPYEYVSAGLTYLIGSDWFELFDIIVCNAGKPSFFTSRRPFRRLCMSAGRRVLFETVTQIERGVIYINGSFTELCRLTRHPKDIDNPAVVHELSWNGRRILYIGDNLQADLVDPRRSHGWTTAAIIRELEDEIRVQNSHDYRRALIRLLALEELMRRIQASETLVIRSASTQNPRDVEGVLDRLERERDVIRHSMSRMLHKNFGSVFRSGNYPTMLAFSLSRFVDLYTSRLENLLTYAVNHRWLPHRRTLPHEPRPFDADIKFVLKTIQQQESRHHYEYTHDHHEHFHQPASAISVHLPSSHPSPPPSSPIAPTPPIEERDDIE